MKRQILVTMTTAAVLLTACDDPEPAEDQEQQPVFSAAISGDGEPNAREAEPTRAAEPSRAAEPRPEADQAHPEADQVQPEADQAQPEADQAQPEADQAAAPAEETTEPVEEPNEAPTERAEPAVELTAEMLETEGIGLSRLVMAHGVEDRTPVEPASSFEAEDERIFAYLEVNNPERQEQELSIAWAPLDDPDDEISRVEVHVGPHPRWRTWAYTRQLDDPGLYVAVVRDASDQIIARHPFEVTR